MSFRDPRAHTFTRSTTLFGAALALALGASACTVGDETEPADPAMTEDTNIVTTQFGDLKAHSRLTDGLIQTALISGSEDAPTATMTIDVATMAIDVRIVGASDSIPTPELSASPTLEEANQILHDLWQGAAGSYSREDGVCGPNDWFIFETWYVSTSYGCRTYWQYCGNSCEWGQWVFSCSADPNNYSDCDWWNIDCFWDCLRTGGY